MADTEDGGGDDDAPPAVAAQLKPTGTEGIVEP
jgi:hypothetical protein